MPSAYLQGIFTQDSILKYEGKLIKITVNADTVVISPTSINEDLNHRTQQITLPLNTTIESILPVENCFSLSNADIGNKAKGFADLKLISDQQKIISNSPGCICNPFLFLQTTSAKGPYRHTSFITRAR